MNSPIGSPTSNESSCPDISVRHLYAAYARLDLLLRRQVERWRTSGQDPTDAFRGLYVSDGEAQSLLERSLGGSWSDFASIDESGFQEAVQAVALQSRALSQSAAAQGNPTRLDRLVNLLHLSPFDIDVILLALAPSLDLRYQRIYGYLQDDITRKTPTVNLALDLFARQNERFACLTRFDPAAPLYRHRLLSPTSLSGPLLAHPLQIDPAVSSWLLGQYSPDGLQSFDSTGPDPNSVPAGLPIYDPGLILAFTGPDQLAQRRAARAISVRSERPLLTLDVSPVAEGDNRIDRIQRTLRDALLLHAIPFFTGWDAVLQHDAAPPNVLSVILGHPEMVITSSKMVWQARGVARSRRIHRLAFPVPGFRQRLSMWEQSLEDHSNIQALDLPHLAGQFALTTSQIRDACEAARDTAAHRKPEADSADLLAPSRTSVEVTADDLLAPSRTSVEVTADDLLAASRSHSNPRLGAMARKIDARFGWDDIVLPREQLTILREITATVRQRPKVLDEWGVGEKLASSRGVTVLFAGPPGTGKTMAAEIMSHDLGLDSYKIDLSGVVSKYIGETEKNLEKVFEEAATSNAILFFDEADALFGKRSEVRDAHDRYANLEISYLLQRMEAYDGVTILATNLRANLDDAFTRRLQFAVDFPFPEEEDRLRIWEALLPPRLPFDRQIDFPLLARRFRIAGGNIRNVIVAAAYLAAADGGVVTMEHLLHGTRRELQKMGRLLNEEDLVVG